MDFSRDHRISPTRLLTVCAVVLLHVALLYALVTGTARRVAHAIAHPIVTKIIVDTKPLPPPRTNAPPPKLDAPRLSKVELPYIPIPEIHIQPPPQRQTAISAVTNVKPETSAAPVVPPLVTPEALTPKPRLRHHRRQRHRHRPYRSRPRGRSPYAFPPLSTRPRTAGSPLTLRRLYVSERKAPCSCGS